MGFMMKKYVKILMLIGMVFSMNNNIDAKDREKGEVDYEVFVDEIIAVSANMF